VEISLDVLKISDALSRRYTMQRVEDIGKQLAKYI